MKIKIILICLTMITVITGNICLDAESSFVGHTEKNVTEVYDLEGNYIFSTAMGVVPDDRYISQDNIEYVVREVEDDRAIAEKKGEINLIEDEATAMPPLAVEDKSTVGIYHTHNAESYVPEIDANGAGDVHEIGKVFKRSLEQNAVNVIHSENMHIPHDGGAYSRSKHTVKEILEHNPDAIFDIHRDAIPDENEYIYEENGRKLVQTRLVIGRQNPNKDVNEEFARHLKAVSDERGGLIRDIFYGQGEYNQSLHPRNILLEVGTFGNNKEEAKVTATRLGEKVSLVLYGDRGEPISQAGEQRSAWNTIAWILGIFIAGTLGYLYINERSWEGVMERLREFFNREIIDRFNNR